MSEITRDQLTVEYGTTAWGGVTATAYVNHHQFERYSYTLQSSEGLEGVPSDARGHGIHIVHKQDGTWLGMSPTFEVDKALDVLVDHLNGELVRRRIGDYVSPQLGDLSDALREFSSSLRSNSHLSPMAGWMRVQVAVAELNLAMSRYSNVPS